MTSVPFRKRLWYDVAMPQEKSAQKARLILRLSNDRVAMLSGSFCSLVVMILCFFYSGVDGVEVAIRVGTAFVLTYAAVFLSVTMIQRAARRELSVRPPKRAAAKEEGTQGRAPGAAGPGGLA